MLRARVARLILAQPQEWVHSHGDDLLRRAGGDLFDVHPALAGGHHHHAAARPIEHHAQVDLLADVGARIDQHLLDRQALDVHPQDAPGDLLGFLRAPGELDAARLAAAADQHLRLDHHRAAEALGDGARLSRRRGHITLRHRDAELPKDAFGLVFLKFQGGTSFDDGWRHVGVSSFTRLTMLLTAHHTVQWIRERLSPAGICFCIPCADATDAFSPSIHAGFNP